MAWLRHCAGCVALLGLLAPVAAGAAPVAEPDARAVRQVVEAQLDAFAADINGCVVVADSGQSLT